MLLNQSNILELAIVADIGGTDQSATNHELAEIRPKAMKKAHKIPAMPLIPGLTESLLPALPVQPLRLSLTLKEFEDLVGERIQDFNKLKAVDLTGAVALAKQAG